MRINLVLNTVKTCQKNCSVCKIWVRSDLVDAQLEAYIYKGLNATRSRIIETLRGNHVPTGDLDHGYRCGACDADIEYPEEQDYCMVCGGRIDWRTWAEPDPDADHGEYDSWRDYQFDLALENGA